VGSAHSPRVGGLAPRQAIAVRLLARGLTAHEIAHRMGIAKGTVDVMIAKARYRLGANNRPHLVYLWMLNVARENENLTR
jgi:DNA-binding CsgD family transcriptional regulator